MDAKKLQDQNVYGSRHKQVTHTNAQTLENIVNHNTI